MERASDPDTVHEWREEPTPTGTADARKEPQRRIVRLAFSRIESPTLFLDMRPASDIPEYVQQVRMGEQPVIEDDPELEGVTVFEELPNPERHEER